MPDDDGRAARSAAWAAVAVVFGGGAVAAWVAGYIYTTDTEGAPTWDQVASQEDGLAVRREVARLEQSQEYGQPLKHYSRIPARSCISGWVLFAVNRNPAGGTPACTAAVEDDLGNIYSETLPKSRPRIYGPIQDRIGRPED